MAKRIPLKDRPPLIRDPADWARDWGWVPPGKARNDAASLRRLAEIMRGALDGDEGVEMWAKECERIANRIDPDRAIEARRRSKVAAMRER